MCRLLARTLHAGPSDSPTFASARESRGAVGGEVVVSPRPTMSEEGAAPPVPSFPEKCNIKDAKTALLKMIVDAENDGEMKAENEPGEVRGANVSKSAPSGAEHDVVQSLRMPTVPISRRAEFASIRYSFGVQETHTNINKMKRTRISKRTAV